MDETTLADWARRLDPEGSVPALVELLSQTNEILTDMRWMEGNLPELGRTPVRTGLPTAAWRLLLDGVKPAGEHEGVLETWSETTGAATMLELKCGTYVIAIQDLSALKQVVLFLDSVTGAVTREVSDKNRILRNEVYQLKLADQGAIKARELLRAERDTAVARLKARKLRKR